MFKAAVYRLRGSVGGPGKVEVGKVSAAAFFRVRPSTVTSCSAAGTPWLTEAISVPISSRPSVQSGLR